MNQEPDADELLDRLVRSVAGIPDPILRARKCVSTGDDLRGAQSRLADVRRRAVYEATLQPGATGKSVSEALGVSAKTVSLASSEFRREDLALLRSLVSAARQASPDSRDVAHAEAMLASTSSIGVLAHVTSNLFGAWLIAENGGGRDDDAAEGIYEGFKRAEYLTQLAGLQRADRVRGAETVEDSTIPASLRRLGAVLNAMPGVHGWASLDDRADGREWSLWWTIESADPNLDVGDVGPSRDGWLVTEWLTWLVRDFRLAGRRIASSVTAPPPMINEPGAMMTFYVEAALNGPDAVDPDEFADSIVRLWDGDAGVRGTGYFDIDWPVAPA